MKKVFEDEFSAIQVDMVDICSEYAEYDADKVFLYASYEQGVLSCDYFYEMKGEILQRHKLNLLGKKYDVSIERQRACMEILYNDLKDLIDLCKKYHQEPPKEIRIVYDTKKNSLRADYKYENVYSQYQNKLPNDVSNEWYQEEKSKKVNKT